MRTLGISIVASAVALAYACGSSTTKQDGGPGDGKHDAPADAHGPDAPLDAPPGTNLLTVKNYEVWCSVQVGSGAFSTAAVQNVFVAPGEVPLVAKPAGASFELGSDMWHHVDGDTGSGVPGSQTGTGVNATSTTMVNMPNAPKCIWVCCPFTNGTGCEPATIGEQCP